MGGGITTYIKWYKKRIKRIYVPYEIFLIILLIVHLLKGISLKNINWIWLVLGLQGSVVGVLGAEQTWFITPLLICYVITPHLCRICNQIKWIKITLIVSICIPVLSALIPNVAFNTILSLVSVYVIAFALGHYFINVNMTLRKTVIAFICMCVSFMIRLEVRFLADGTILYDRITVKYTQAIAAFCIFLMIAYIFNNVKPSKLIEFVSRISFEIYLVHYMFCVGPIKLFGMTKWWITDCILVTIISVIVAAVVNKISQCILDE